MKYKAIFIDLDNTLYDFAANSREAYHEVFDLLKYDRFFPSFDHYFAIYSLRNDELWRLYDAGAISKDELNRQRYLHPLQVAGVDDAETLSRTFFSEAMKRLPYKGLLRPHAKECLDYLYPRYPLYILSNGFTELQRSKMHSAGIDHYFTDIVLSEDIGINKPQRELFDYALTVSGTTPADTLMIGDSMETDMEGARNAGWDQMFYNYKNISPLSFQPTYEIHSLLEVKDIL